MRNQRVGDHLSWFLISLMLLVLNVDATSSLLEKLSIIDSVRDTTTIKILLTNNFLIISAFVFTFIKTLITRFETFTINIHYIITIVLSFHTIIMIILEGRLF